MSHRPALLDRPEVVKRLDASEMAVRLRNFPIQVESAVRLGESLPVPRNLGGPIEKIIFVGMGGSAISGDVIRSLLSFESKIPIWVSRHYKLPPFVDAKTLCVFSSYSGDTEETLSAFREGLGRGVKSVVVSSGGELGRLSMRSSVFWIQIPSGIPPRSALGYLIFPVLNLLAHLKLWKLDKRSITETFSLLKAQGQKNTPLRFLCAKIRPKGWLKNFGIGSS